MGLVSSSLDASLAILDLERRKVAATVSLHKKGVHTFGYSPAFSLVARCLLRSAGLRVGCSWGCRSCTQGF